MKPEISSLIVQIYHYLLRLYPAAFRAEFGDEMETVSAATAREAAEEGAGTVLAVLLKEVVDFPASLADAYRQEPIYVGVTVMKREASWNVWPLWVVLNLLAIPLAVLAIMLLVVLVRPLIHLNGLASLDVLPAILYGLVVGIKPLLQLSQAILYGSMLILVTTVLQWLFLRRYLENAAVWIPLTIVGWLAGILLIYLIRPIAEITANEWLPALIPPLLGALVGLAQSLYLRRVAQRAGYWVLASTIGYGLLARGVFGSFTSIPEFVLFILAPFAITGLALVLLLRQGEIAESKKQNAENKKRVGFLAWGMLLLIPLFFAGSWVYATGQLTLAKANGIYATPEEGMEQEIIKGAEKSPVERVEIITAGVNANDGSQPHVWFVRAWIFADQRPDGRPTERGYGGGSYFLRVKEGWVHVPEGAFPEFIGWVMTLYGLEGA